MYLWIVSGLFSLAGLSLAVWAVRGDRARGRRRCPCCWYDMAGTPEMRCPECGRDWARGGERILYRHRRRWRITACGLLVALGSSSFVAIDVARTHGWRAAPRLLVIYATPWMDLSWPRFSTDAQRHPMHRTVLGEIVESPLTSWEHRVLIARLNRTLRTGSDPSRPVTSFITAAARASHDMDACVPVLFELLHAPDTRPGSEVWALEILTGASSAHLEQWTLVLTKHPSAITRARAAQVIGRIAAATGDIEAVSALVTALYDTGPEAASAAAFALPLWAAPLAIRPLEQLLASPDADRVWLAAPALARFGPAAESALPALHERLADPRLNEDNRAEIARAIHALTRR